MRNYTKWLVFLGIAFLFVMVGGFFVTEVALAQDFGTGYLGGLSLPSDDLRTIVVRIINITLGVIGIIFLIFILYGGFLWMTARGNQQQVSKAQKIIINATTGLIIIFMAFAITALVFNFLTGSGGGGPGPCIDGTPQGCYECQSGVWVRHPEWSGCSLPTSEFRIDDIQTAHGGSNDSHDVYLCSSVQAITNNVINGLTVTSDNVKLTKDGTAPGPYDTPVEVALSAGSKWMEMIPEDLLDQNSFYTARYDEAITDMSLPNLPLSVCNEPGCSKDGTEFVWTFETGTTVDTIAPEIILTSPTFEDPFYPDRNVNRDKIIKVRFNESVRASTIEDGFGHPIDTNIYVQEIDGEGGTPVGLPIPATDYTVELKADGFDLIYDNPEYYKAFTWYRVTVQNIEDLCGNAMAEPLIWEFQTNDVVPGVGGWYPTGGGICPDVGLATLTFNTSMEYNWVKIEIFDDITLPPYLEATLFPGGPYEVYVGGNRWWVDETSDFRVFTFDFDHSLLVNTRYDIKVTTDKVIDIEGNTLGHDWFFIVSDPATCTCSPYISHMVPDEGYRSECVTIYGQCFKGAVPNNTSDPRYAEISAMSFDGVAVIPPLPENYEPTYVVTTVPESFVLGDGPKPQVTITYNDLNLGSLNTVNESVYYYVASGDLSEGPCLFSVNPNQACHGDPLQLNGIRFGADPGAGSRANDINNVTFDATDGTPPPFWADNPEPSSWSETLIDVQVQNLTDDGNIRVTVANLQSNPLDIEIACPIDSRCSSAPFPACSPEQSMCEDGLICNDACSCVEPDGPRVDYWEPDCDASCIDALIWARFSEELEPGSIDSDSVEVYLCGDENCYLGELVSEINSSILYVNGPDPEWRVNITLNDPLAASADYRVILHNEIENIYGESLVGLNFDSGSGFDDSFSWTFGTRPASEPCEIIAVSIAPQTANATYLNQTIGYNAYAETETLECGMQQLNPYNYNWLWESESTPPGVASITNNPDPNPPQFVLPVQVATALAEGTAEIKVSEVITDFSDTGDLIVNFSHTYPEVFDWDPICGVSCRNVAIWALFTEPMDESSIIPPFPAPSPIDVFLCQDENCLRGELRAEITTSISYDNSIHQVNIAPVGELDGLRWYRVILHEGILGRSGEPLAGLNFDSSDDGIDVDDSFSWTFGTRHDACLISAVRVTPHPYTATTLSPPSIEYNAYAEAENLACGNNQSINRSDYQWTWDSSIDMVAEISNIPLFSPTQMATVISEIRPFTDITAETEGLSNYGRLNVTLITCEDSMDCTDGNTICPGSFCDEDTYTCTPVITEELSPPTGPKGRWVTIKGCYFGNAPGSVDFGGKTAGIPACYDWWQNERIIMEVPDIDTVDSYPVSVVTDRGPLQSNSRNFVLINECLPGVSVPPDGVPGLCRLIPERGAINSDVRILGAHFTDVPLEPDDNVTFEQFPPPGRTPPAATTRWNDTSIDATVPDDAFTGYVKVEVDSCPSNPLPYEVSIGLGTRCSSEPWPMCSPDDSDCGQNTQLYCDRTACICQYAPRPSVVSIEPINMATNVCRNVAIRVEFDQAMNHASVRENIELVYEDLSCELGFNQGYEESPSLKRIVKAWFNKLTEIIFGQSKTAYGQAECPWDIASIQVYDVDDNGDDKITGIEDHSYAIVTPSGDLAPKILYRIKVGGGVDGVKNIYGRNMAVSRDSEFTTGPEVCEIGNVTIFVLPPGPPKTSDTFSCAGQNDCPGDQDLLTPDNQHQYRAEARDKSGIFLLDVDYDWTKHDPAEAFTFSTPGIEIADPYVTNSIDDGATATFIVRVYDDDEPDLGEATRILLVRNDLCEVPWPARTFGTPFIDTDVDFSFWYCRAKTENLRCFNTGLQEFTSTSCEEDVDCSFPEETCEPLGLPELSWVEEFGPTYSVSDTGDPLRKEYLFLLPAPSADAIALRVHSNKEFLSPEYWYSRYVPNQGSPQSMEVNGYPAVRDGRTVYVSPAKETGGGYTTQMFLLSYNRNADSDTVKIYNALLANWEFTLNLLDYNICIGDFSVYCTDDETCEEGSNGLCMIYATKIRRDTQRMVDLSSIYSLAYKHYAVCANDPDRGCGSDGDCPSGSCVLVNGIFPSLPSATYEIGRSTSRWPSWNKTLASALNTSNLPVDPFNTFNGCPVIPPGYDPQSCWNDTTKEFKCEDGSHIYQYETVDGGAAFGLYANFELDGPGFEWTTNNAIDKTNNDSCTDFILFGTSDDRDGDGFTFEEGDCDDNDVTVYPPPPRELCDGKDNDCNGIIDEGCPSDIDSDTYTIGDGDCNDLVFEINPGRPEICWDGVDNNCDGEIDEGCPLMYDNDGDGWYVETGDCRDDDPEIHPTHPEWCDGKDNNCDTVVDEGCGNYES